MKKRLTQTLCKETRSTVLTPQPPPFENLPEGKLGQDFVRIVLDNHAERLQGLHEAAQKEAKLNTHRAPRAQYSAAQTSYEQYASLTEEQIHPITRALNGEIALSEIRIDRTLFTLLSAKNRILSAEQFSFAHLVRLLACADKLAHLMHTPLFEHWLKQQALETLDLRALAQVFTHTGQPLIYLARACLQAGVGERTLLETLPAKAIWPFFAEHPEFIDQALGLTPRAALFTHHAPDLSPVLCTLASFPTLPERWTKRLLDIALESKTHKKEAQAVLEHLPELEASLSGALKSPQHDTRTHAAQWLARRGNKSSVPALYNALHKETHESSRAALLSALAQLGQDIQEQLSPEKLLTEAEKGLQKSPPRLTSIPLEKLPPCTWQNGTPIDPKIIQWWLVLACKLKEPAGNALLTRYLSLLCPESAATLGRFVLERFIAYDTLTASEQEAEAYAHSHASTTYTDHQQNAIAHPKDKFCVQMAARSLNFWFEMFKRNKLAEYTGSAINEKGLLAFIVTVPTQALVPTLRAYMHQHSTRRAQIEAMLTAAASTDDPLVIELLLSIARRHRTASMQALARTLIAQIGARSGWTQDALADLITPTAGLDESGKLVLDYGSRQFVVTLDSAMKFELRTPEGKIIKALPEARQNEKSAVVKEAKTQLSASKKELKQVLEQQSARLHQAMNTQRHWLVAQWQEHLASHPIVGKLAQQLIWRVFEANGEPAELLRPTQEGKLINECDQEITLQAAQSIALAHGSRMNDTQIQAWQKHLKAYNVKPLFTQLSSAFTEQCQ